VHRLIVCGRSEFFKNCVDGPFREGEKGVVSLEEDDPDAVEAMIQYLYTGDYNGATSKCRLLLHAKVGGIRCDVHVWLPLTMNQVYSIAHKYMMQDLQQTSYDQFQSAIDRYWQTDDFPKVVEYMYSSIPLRECGLWNTAMGICADNVDRLLEKSGFSEMLDGNGAISTEILKTGRRKTSLNCPNCAPAPHVQFPVEVSTYSFWRSTDEALG
jgi:speckle-type POZ protein